MWSEISGTGCTRAGIARCDLPNGCYRRIIELMQEIVAPDQSSSVGLCSIDSGGLMVFIRWAETATPMINIHVSPNKNDTTTNTSRVPETQQRANMKKVLGERYRTTSFFWPWKGYPQHISLPSPAREPPRLTWPVSRYSTRTTPGQGYGCSRSDHRPRSPSSADHP